MVDVKIYEVDDSGKELMKEIEKILDEVHFQISGNRKHLTYDNARPMSMPVGMVKQLNGTYKLPVIDEWRPDLYPLIRKVVNIYAPNFDYNAGYINKNVQMIPHKDKNNVDTSIIFGLGDYEGGELNIEGQKVDIKYRLIEFDGKRHEHWTEYFKGNRYSVILYEI
jgi:hypothetical protein